LYISERVFVVDCRKTTATNKSKATRRVSRNGLAA
jgi:hypothetical protein